MSNAELRAMNANLVTLLRKMRDRIDDKLAEIAAISGDDDGDDDDAPDDDDDDEFSANLCDED